MLIDELFVKVEFKGNRREIFLNDTETGLRAGDYAVVEVESGLDLGTIRTRGCGKGNCDGNCQEKSGEKGNGNSIKTTGPALAEPAHSGNGNGNHEADTDSDSTNGVVRRILRVANHEEINRLMENRKAEDAALVECEQLVQHHGLNMKLVDVEYQFDRKKITFFYTADERVDFRQLVKDLASIFRTRIEMRQIGARDEARRIGGVGSCGQELCCTRFMEGFEPINTQYAKDQNLPINPSKLSGACGKLKCCLRFEWDFYAESLKDFPSPGIPVELPNGIGTICSNDILNRRVTVAFENGATEMLELNQVKTILTQMAEDSRRKSQ
ncbi:MAG: Signal peptidase-like protein [Candidatus Marinimicrobia bacterium]|nr:Signal peptidase-like protein [Candidatus Neomarinimicrobiota bacterium]